MKPVTYPFTRKMLSTATEQKVLFEEMSPTVLHVKLNSPKSLNSVDLPMVNLILDELK
jgi:enoyl-CoA hydratase/carnithine racemase